jgi:hypothetical protein
VDFQEEKRAIARCLGQRGKLWRRAERGGSNVLAFDVPRNIDRRQK